MYFSINSAFNHHMSTFGFSSKDVSPQQLLIHEPIFDIFLHTSSKPRLIYNQSSPILPLNTPDTLLKLFQSIQTRSPYSPNSSFFPIVRHTSNEKPRNGSFLTLTPAHIMYLTTSCVLMCILAPQTYLAIKHKKLSTLVGAMTLQRLPATEALSDFEIHNSKETK